MMLFNLTKAATEHLFPESVAKQQGDIIQQHRGENIILYERDSEKKDTVDFVFYLHAIKVKQFYCIVAIEKETRWVHIIHHIKKGDVREFTRRFHERLVNGVANMIMHVKPNLRALLEMTVGNYTAANQEMLLYIKVIKAAILIYHKLSGSIEILLMNTVSQVINWMPCILIWSRMPSSERLSSQKIIFTLRKQC